MQLTTSCAICLDLVLGLIEEVSVGVSAFDFREELGNDDVRLGELTVTGEFCAEGGEVAIRSVPFTGIGRWKHGHGCSGSACPLQ
jgi:hypothetical protein